jgi:hypothetical protein
MKILTSPTDSFKVKFEGQVLMDFNSLSYFFEFYIYDCPQAPLLLIKLPDICHYISNSPKPSQYAIPESFKNKVSSLKDLTFTKKIYIYHEFELTSNDINEITKILKEQNIIAEFRGPLYPDEKKLSKSGGIWFWKMWGNGEPPKNW